jgi:sialidase-1
MDYQVLATRGVGGYRQYRIPAMAVTPSGKLIAIYDGRADLDDLPGPVDLIMRTSIDNGDTWSAPEIFLASAGIKGYGDASIIIDPSVGNQGRIIVLSQTSQLASFFESSLGSDMDDPTVVHIALSYSDDDGVNWQHKIITEQVKDSVTHGIFATSGMGSRITSGAFEGRLIHSFVLRRGGQLLSALAFSDDHGLTWNLGAEIPNGNETAVAALGDGSIIFHSRATPYRVSGRSLDGGLSISERQPHPELPDPSDNGSLLTINENELICTHNHDTDLRRRTVAKRSYDGGKSWPEAVVIEQESSAYSTACQLPDGRVGVLFERNGYTEMVFARFEMTEFRPVGEVLPLQVDHNMIGFDVIFRFVRPGRNSEQLEIVSKSTNKFIPKIDMSVFRKSERKEIGPSSGSASGDPVFTKSEFDQILGSVSPGVHLGDELRFSGRIFNNSAAEISEIQILAFGESVAIDIQVLKPGERLNFLDIRHVVSEQDLKEGLIKAKFSWRARGANQETLSGEKVIKLSTATGLPTT